MLDDRNAQRLPVRRPPNEVRRFLDQAAPSDRQGRVASGRAYSARRAAIGPGARLLEFLFTGPHADDLFPGAKGGKTMSTRQLSRLFHEAADAAGIRKGVSLHALRHYAESRIMPSDFRFLLADSGKLESNSA
jgi:hypothetical protein